MALLSTAAFAASDHASAQTSSCSDRSWDVSTHTELDAAIACNNSVGSPGSINLLNSISYPAGAGATPLAASPGEAEPPSIRGHGYSVTAGAGALATFTVQSTASSSVLFSEIIIDGAERALVVEGDSAVLVNRSTLRGTSRTVVAQDQGWVRVWSSIIEGGDVAVANDQDSGISVIRSSVVGTVSSQGRMAVTSSTIDGNIDVGFAAGADPHVEISNATLTGRIAVGDGRVNLVSSIVVGGCINQDVSGNNNLGTDCPGSGGSASGEIEALADNGCAVPTPTGCPLTVALSVGSAAIDQGVSSNVVLEVDRGFERGTPRYDQRGPGYVRVNGPSADIGAFEAAATDARPTLISQDSAGGFLGGAESGDAFGAALTTEAGILVVGSPGEDGRDGAIALFFANEFGVSQSPFDAIAGFYTFGEVETGSALASGNFGGGFTQFAIGSPGRIVNGEIEAGVIDIRDDFGYYLEAHADKFGVAGTAEQGDRFGEALAVGDFNNDGRDDLVVGTPGEDIGSRSNAGAVTIFYGGRSSAGGLATGRSQPIHAGIRGVAGAPEVDDEFGAALIAGDFNGDGFDDLAIGAPGETIGTKTSAGAVTVINGSVDGLDPSQSRVLHAGTRGVAGLVEPDDRFGATLAAGDLNSDTIDDLVIGSPGESLGNSANAGAVVIINGGTAGLGNAGSRGINGRTRGLPGTGEQGDEFGGAVLVGDYDNDAINDLIIGSPGESLGTTANSGAIHILPGTGTGISTTDAIIITGRTSGLPGSAGANDRFGSALVLAPFDGVDNSLIIGIPGKTIGTSANAGAIIELSPAG